MNYALHFKKKALKQWNKLDPSVRSAFLNILERRLENPRLKKHQLKGDPDFYKIKLRSVGYRLVYHVDDEIVTVTVLTVGKRDTVYKF
ncbi:type II toxin-antitoxin system mRNA interferase toxin, RelE/StbE family [Tamilnaduibacter salinus]|uniref:Type II toxin-antitoxin system mRNA interferase toxin, RelE/StbE family n=1 Tax=Tamilnaduibacter salinus TaxID=1484056 RepID=A0A2A2I802_9GAMM|nr:type II toxin-antitoxin system RelE/ParE family toxin [Tamilnaduibacter salinus]PAV27245.1 type II toxin-antitoxin system mRNA interferase toxin, RelE/StbE family [Tamilnaduibacter salinus]